MNVARPRSVRISTIMHATEDLEKVVQAILTTCPQDFPRKVETLRVKGHYGNEIAICRLRIDGRDKAERFVDHLWERLEISHRKLLYTGLDKYVDSVGTLHLRIDKQKASEGQLALGSTDPVKVEISFRSRGTKEESVEVLRKSVTMQAEPAEASSPLHGDAFGQ